LTGKIKSIKHRDFCNIKKEGNWFSQVGKTIRTELLCKKKILLNDQTSQAKSSPEPVSLPYAPPLKAAFTQQTKVGKLVLANSSWWV